MLVLLKIELDELCVLFIEVSSQGQVHVPFDGTSDMSLSSIASQSVLWPIMARISSSSREWFSTESRLPALAERRELESSGDFERRETLETF